MSNEQGFDDQFNEGLFRTTLNNTRLERPGQWPRSVSEMRHHTSYGGEAMTNKHDAEHSAYVVRTPQAPNGEWHYHHGRHSWVWVDGN